MATCAWKDQITQHPTQALHFHRSDKALRVQFDTRALALSRLESLLSVRPQACLETTHITVVRVKGRWNSARFTEHCEM